MSKRRKRPAGVPWSPMVPATRRPIPPERIAAIREYAIKEGHDPDAAERIATEEVEIWKNERYTVIVRRDGPDDHIVELSVRRNDRKPDIPWRHLQRIKNEIAGDEVEAIELYPAESRLVDTANQRWLWCMAPGKKLPVGFDSGRHVVDDTEAVEVFGARQAVFDD